MVSKKDNMRNVYVKDMLKVTPINKKWRESRLTWFGHVKCNPDNYVVKRVPQIKTEGKRQQG